MYYCKSYKKYKNKYRELRGGGRFPGFRRKKYVNRDEYTGLWKDGVPHGSGIYSYHNGDKYQGNFEQGKKNGHGIFFS